MNKREKEEKWTKELARRSRREKSFPFSDSGVDRESLKWGEGITVFYPDHRGLEGQARVLVAAFPTGMTLNGPNAAKTGI